MKNLKRILTERIIISSETKKKFKKFSLIFLAVVYVMVTLPLLLMFISMWFISDPY